MLRSEAQKTKYEQSENNFYPPRNKIFKLDNLKEIVPRSITNTNIRDFMINVGKLEEKIERVFREVEGDAQKSDQEKVEKN